MVGVLIDPRLLHDTLELADVGNMVEAVEVIL